MQDLHRALGRKNYAEDDAQLYICSVLDKSACCVRAGQGELE